MIRLDKLQDFYLLKISEAFSSSSCQKNQMLPGVKSKASVKHFLQKWRIPKEVIKLSPLYFMRFTSHFMSPAMAEGSIITIIIFYMSTSQSVSQSRDQC